MLSTKARAIVDAVAGSGIAPDFIAKEVARLAAKRKIPTIGAGEKLVMDKHGHWVVEKVEPERFRKSGGLSPSTISFVKKMIQPDSMSALLKELPKDMNNADRAQVLAVTQQVAARSIHSRRHVLKLSKRAPQTAITQEEMQGRAPMQPRNPKSGFPA